MPAGTIPIPAAGAPDSTPIPPRPPKGVGALFSCSAGQRAYEHKNLKHGVFFHYVLEGLRGEAQDRQGRVTFPALAAYVQENVPGKVAELLDQKEQLPNLRADLIGVPPVMLRMTSQPESSRPLAGGREQGTVPAPRPSTPPPIPLSQLNNEEFPLTAPPVEFGDAPAPPGEVRKSPIAPPRTAPAPAEDDSPPPPPAPG